MKFNEILKSLRKEKSESQTQLANALGLQRYIIANWEQGRAEPNIEDIVQLANYFDISLDYLLGRDNDFVPYQNNSKIPNMFTISDKEKEMLSLYRSLLPEMQDLVITMMKSIHSDKVDS